MNVFPWELLIIAILLLIVLYLSRTEAPKQIAVGGLVLTATLEDIFKYLITPELLDITAILTPSKQVVWSKTKELKLSDDYSVIHDYILIFSKQTNHDVNHLDGYDAYIRDKLARVFAKDVFKGSTDASGYGLNETSLELHHTFYAISAVFLILAVILYGRHIFIKRAGRT